MAIYDGYDRSNFSNGEISLDKRDACNGSATAPASPPPAPTTLKTVASKTPVMAASSDTPAVLATAIELRNLQVRLRKWPIQQHLRRG